MKKISIFAVLAVSILLMSSFALAAKPESPPGLSKVKNVNAPGHWKKTTEYESQRHFVNDIHSRILSRLADRDVFPIGLMRLVNDFLLAFGVNESEEISNVSVSGEVVLSEEGNNTLRQLVESLNGTEGKHELNLTVKKQNDTVIIERNETVGNLTQDQLALWIALVGIVETLVEGAEDDDELVIEIKHELEI